MSDAVPALEAYATWLEGCRTANPVAFGRGSMAADAYRRIVTMKRAGSNYRQIAQRLGRSSDGIKRAYLRLPEELR